ncbi:MAG: hypothetical protein KQJ78_01685 [Deltaproteobacteria bacterium]|nr:hypothetical protein [Deltaproteobacteria bacterium]
MHDPTRGKIKCPACGSLRLARLVYGLWGAPPSPDILEALDRGEVMLGEWDFGPTSPSHACLDCGHQFRCLQLLE